VVGLWHLCWPYCMTQCIRDTTRIVLCWKLQESRTGMTTRAQSHKLKGELEARIVYSPSGSMWDLYLAEISLYVRVRLSGTW
jgi:hypothetical protein